MDPRIETYLDRATEGLAGDEELRLDVKAELRTHFEAAAEETGGDSAVEETLESFGDVVELADGLARSCSVAAASCADSRIRHRGAVGHGHWPSCRAEHAFTV